MKVNRSNQQSTNSMEMTLIQINHLDIFGVANEGTSKKEVSWTVVSLSMFYVLVHYDMIFMHFIIESLYPGVHFQQPLSFDGGVTEKYVFRTTENLEQSDKLMLQHCVVVCLCVNECFHWIKFIVLQPLNMKCNL